MERSLRPLDVVAAVVLQAAGIACAYVCAWIALFTLSSVGMFGDTNDAGTRTWGLALTIVGATALPAGLWYAAARLRSCALASAAGCISLLALLLAVGVFGR